MFDVVRVLKSGVIRYIFYIFVVGVRYKGIPVFWFWGEVFKDIYIFGVFFGFWFWMIGLGLE